METDGKKYRVVRFFFNSGRRRIVKWCLPLSLAQEHCCNPQTSSSSCTDRAGKARTRKFGPWFDAYEEIK